LHPLLRLANPSGTYIPYSCRVVLPQVGCYDRWLADMKRKASVCLFGRPWTARDCASM